MTEEQKKAETAKAEAEAKAKEKEQEDADFEAEIADLSEEEQEAKRAERESAHNDNSTDYEAELKAEQARREKAEAALAKERARKSKERREAEEGEEADEDLDDEDDKPILKKDLPSILARERASAYKEAQADRIQEIAAGLAESDAEARLIVEIHKNRSFPSDLSLRDQLEEAQAIANRKRNKSKTTELARAVKSKDTASKDVAAGHRDALTGTAPKFDSKTTASNARAGFIWNIKTKRLEKVLPDKSILVKDHKTGRTYRA